MAWDDEPPSATELAPVKAGSWDSEPPTKEELGPQWSDLPKNIIPNAVELGKGSLETTGRIMKGISDLPSDVVDTVKGELQGESPLDSPLAEDAKTVGKGVWDAAKGIPRSLMDLGSKEAWVNRPVSNAITAGSLAAPFLRGKGAVPGIAAEEPVAAAAAKEAGIPKELPVMEPGAKTGDPHALFSFNDSFGPEGKPRSMYTMYGDPEHPTFGKKSSLGSGGYGSTVTKADLDELGVPVIGREARSVGKWDPLDLGESPKGPGEAPPPPPKGEAAGEAPKADPLQDVKDYIAQKAGKIEQTPDWQQNAAKYVKNEVSKIRGKDIGIRDPMIRSMDPKHPLAAIDKAEALMEYADQKGYFRPGLTDVARKDLIQSRTQQAGKGVGAIRDLASQRGAPPIDEIRNAVKAQLTEEYGHKAPREINNALGDFDRIVKKDPTFSGLAEAATYLNSEKTPVKNMSQHPGPTTDAANIISRMNNEAIRKLLKPEEDAFYTQNLRDYGAHRKLEQMVASAERRGMAGRGAPGGALSSLWQQLWDRGGYRMAGNVADRVSSSVLKNPSKFKTLPDFFEEFAHHANDVVDETINPPNMSQGGVVPKDVRDYVNSRSC